MGLLVVVAKFLVIVTFCNAMTMKQINNTGKMMRKSCQPKNNVEDEKIDKIGEGVFIEEKEVMCYMACIMKMANTKGLGHTPHTEAKFGLVKSVGLVGNPTVRTSQAAYETSDTAIEVKNNKINYEAAMKQADLLLPDEIKEPTKAALTACRKVPEGYKDICEASFHVSKCIYNYNPEVFFFP